MPYVHTVLDTPNHKFFVPMPGMGADKAFRYVEARDGKITVRTLAGEEVQFTQLQAGWMLMACRKFGLWAPTRPVEIGTIGGDLCELVCSDTEYTVRIGTQHPLILNGSGLFVLVEALDHCIGGTPLGERVAAATGETP